MHPAGPRRADDVEREERGGIGEETGKKRQEIFRDGEGGGGNERELKCVTG